jgi:hypothetical protein
MHDIKVSYQFIGDFYLPPRESFLSYYSTKNASAGKRYYKYHILADGIFRIIDPSNIEGLTDFEAHREVSAFAVMDVGYKMNVAYSYATAVRKDIGSFDIELFSDAKVTDPDPFTLWIGGGDGFPTSAWKFDDDPVLAPDGSPQLALSVYHYPIGTEIAIGEAPYRIDNRPISVYDLHQSADGLFGGVLVYVPTQTTDYIYLLVLEAVYRDKIASEDKRRIVFLLTVLPKK